MTDHLADARGVLERERRRCVDERESFRAFGRRVADLTPARAPATQRPLLASHADAAGGPLERVRDAYESTVMSVPHYEREYGDTFAESVVAEFGEDVAAAVSGSQSLTPELRDALAAAARSAVAEREDFLELLDREAESVAVADDALTELFDDLVALDSTPLPDRDFDELLELWTALSHAEPRLDRIAARRQRTLARHRHALPGTDVDVTEYLYGDLDVAYPVLVAVADLGELVETARERVARAIAATP